MELTNQPSIIWDAYTWPYTWTLQLFTCDLHIICMYLPWTPHLIRLSKALLPAPFYLDLPSSHLGWKLPESPCLSELHSHWWSHLRYRRNQGRLGMMPETSGKIWWQLWMFARFCICKQVGRPSGSPFERNWGIYMSIHHRDKWRPLGFHDLQNPPYGKLIWKKRPRFVW